MNDSDLRARQTLYSVYLVDRLGIRHLVCRRASVTDCAEVMGDLLRGAPGVEVEAVQDAPGGAPPIHDSGSEAMATQLIE